jgi:hypothetical protein
MTLVQGSIDVRKNRSGNQEWIIQRNWQHWAHKTKTNKTKKHNTACIGDTEVLIQTMFFGIHFVYIDITGID